MLLAKKDSLLGPPQLKVKLLELSTRILEWSNQQLGDDLRVSIATYDKHVALNRLASLPEDSFQDHIPIRALERFRDTVFNRDTSADEIPRLASGSFLR